jgi:hypothetical protein
MPPLWARIFREDKPCFRGRRSSKAPRDFGVRRLDWLAAALVLWWGARVSSCGTNSQQSWRRIHHRIKPRSLIAI